MHERILAESFYIDPNVVGDEGYGLIGPLLLFSPFVVVHSPLGLLHERARRSDRWRASTLSAAELLRGAEIRDGLSGDRPLVRFTAFDTFLDHRYRRRLGEVARIYRGLDTNLVQRREALESSGGLVVRDGDLRRRISRETALESYETIVEFMRKAIAEHRSGIGELPKLYAQQLKLADGRAPWPKLLKDDLKGRPSEEQLAMEVVYDWCNDKIVQISGEGRVHAATMQGGFVARSVHLDLTPFAVEHVALTGATAGRQIDPGLTILASPERSILLAILRPWIGEGPRLTLDQILEFRSTYRSEFLSFVSDVFLRTKDIADGHDRLSECARISREMRNKPFLSEQVIHVVAGVLLQSLHYVGVPSEITDPLKEKLVKAITPRALVSDWRYYLREGRMPRRNA